MFDSYALKLRKEKRVVKLISTPVFDALSKERVKKVFKLNYSQYKIVTSIVQKVSCFPARSTQLFGMVV